MHHNSDSKARGRRADPHGHIAGTTGFAAFASRRPIATFAGLAYAGFWLFLLALAGVAALLRMDVAGFPGWLTALATVLGSWVPGFGGLLVVAASGGRPALGALLRRSARVSVGARWYAAAMVPLWLSLGAGAVCHLAGASPAAHGGPAPAFWVQLFTVTLVSGPLGEELGWRGVALPHLLRRHRPAVAALLMGVLWGGWHAPLWLASGYGSAALLHYCAAFLLAIVALSMLMTWIYRQARGSLVPMVLAHFAFNAGLALAGPAGFGLARTLPLFEVLAGLLALAALTVWLGGGLEPAAP